MRLGEAYKRSLRAVERSSRPRPAKLRLTAEELAVAQLVRTRRGKITDVKILLPYAMIPAREIDDQDIDFLVWCEKEKVQR